jgi:hypothetical protein
VPAIAYAFAARVWEMSVEQPPQNTGSVVPSSL